MKLNALNDPYFFKPITYIQKLPEYPPVDHKLASNILTYVNALTNQEIEQNIRCMYDSFTSLRKAISLTNEQWRLFDQALRAVEDLTGLDLDS